MRHLQKCLRRSVTPSGRPERRPLRPFRTMSHTATLSIPPGRRYVSRVVREPAGCCPICWHTAARFVPLKGGRCPICTATTLSRK